MSLPLVMVLLSLSSLSKADNEIAIDQVGDNLLLGIEQIGSNNKVSMLDANSFINSSSLGMYLVQHNAGGYENRITFDEMTGSGNDMKICQGCSWDVLDSDTNLDWSTDGWESGGHEIDITLYGDDNQLAVQQTNQTGDTDGHNFDLHLAGDDNEVQIKQQGKGSKSIDLTIYNDFNEVFIRQKGTNANHNATITLDGTYGTDLTLKQLGSTTLNYTLSQTCLTVGGCAITVEQGN